mgnify:CR=1 FL=1
MDDVEKAADDDDDIEETVDIRSNHTSTRVARESALMVNERF